MPKLHNIILSLKRGVPSQSAWDRAKTDAEKHLLLIEIDLEPLEDLIEIFEPYKGSYFIDYIKENSLNELCQIVDNLKEVEQGYDYYDKWCFDELFIDNLQNAIIRSICFAFALEEQRNMNELLSAFFWGNI